MDTLLKGNLITTKNAAELSGYTSDYLARLARSGKIVGKKIGHSWLVDTESLARFSEEQGDRKVDYARELARTREAEYRAHHSFPNQITNIPVQTRHISQLDVAKNPPRSNILAFSTTVLVLISAALVAQAGVIQRLAEGTGSLAFGIASGFSGVSGDISSYVASRAGAMNDGIRAQSTNAIARRSLLSARIVSPLEEFNFSPARPLSFFENTPPRSFATLALIPAAPAPTPAHSLETLRASASAMYAFLTTPSLIARTLADTFIAFGAAIIDTAHFAIRADVAFAYNFGNAAPEGARAITALLGNTGDLLARATARVPALATALYLRAADAPATLAPSIASAVFEAEYEIAVRFVALANTTAARYVALISGTGNLAYEGTAGTLTLARAAPALLSRAPAALEDAYLGALGKSALALDSFGARLVSVGHTPLLAAVLPALSAGERAALFTYQTVRDLFDSTLGALAALFGTSSNIAIVSSPSPTVLPFATSTTSVNAPQPTAPPSAPVLPTSAPAPRIAAVTNNYPTYTTVVKGVSEDFVNQSLVSLRTGILATVAGMVQPVATQVATNATTIQQVNMIQDLSNLIVRNGDFRGGIFDNGIRVSATDGNFTNLTGGSISGTTLSASSGTFSGNLTATTLGVGTTSPSDTFALAGPLYLSQISAPSVATDRLYNVSGALYFNGTALGSGGGGSGTVGLGSAGYIPYYASATTTLTATSSLFISTIGNVGIGTTTPTSKLYIYSSDENVANFSGTSGGDSTITIGDTLPAGRIGEQYITYRNATTGGNAWMAGMGDDEHFYIDYGTSGEIIEASSLLQLTQAGTFNVGSLTADWAGNVGIGTTSPYAKLSVVGETVSSYFTATSTTASSFTGGVNTSGTTGGYKIDGNLILTASSTNYATLLGYQAGSALRSVNIQNTAIGYQALRLASSATLNIASFNTAVGFKALTTNTTGQYNTAVGSMALYLNNIGSHNTAIGESALYQNLSGDYNTAVGQNALIENTTGYDNTAVGKDALKSNNVGYGNTAIGKNALFVNDTGTANTAVGIDTLYMNKAGSFNTILGYQAGYGVFNQTVSQNNVFLGYRSGYANTTGSNNIFLGYQTASTTTSGSNNIVIGYDIDAPSPTSANTLNIGNLIFGTGIDGTNTTLSSGNVGIGTTSPYAKLSVVGETVASHFTATSTNATSTFGGDIRLSGLKKIYFDQDNAGIARIGLVTIKLADQLSLYYNGNVGINKEGSPSQDLEITDDPNVALRINSGDVATWDFEVDYNAADTTTRDDLRIRRIAGSGDFTIDNGINVGLGTTSPYAKLSVVGETVASHFTATSTTATSTFSGGMSVGGNNGLNVLSNGQTMIGTNTIPGGAAVLTIRNTAGLSDTLQIDSNTANYQMTLSDGYTDATSKDTAILMAHYSNSSEESIPLISGRALSSSNILFIGGNDIITGEYNAATELRFLTGATNTTLNGTTRMLIDSTGNVGVGTTSPYAKLSVAGQVVGQNFMATSTTVRSIFSGSASFGTTTETGRYNFAGAGGGSYLGYPAVMTLVVDSSNDWNLVYGNKTVSPANWMANYMDNSGNLWFGNANNYGILGIYGGAGTGSVVINHQSGNTGKADLDIFSSSGASGNPKLYFSRQGTLSTGLTLGEINFYGDAVISNAARIVATNNSSTVTDGSFDFYVGSNAGTRALTIANTGNVGIGTTSPYAKLSVVGEAVASYFTATSTTATSTFMGAVGIGTSTPWRTLSVTGTVAFSGITSAIGAGSLCLTSANDVTYNSGSDACLSSLRSTKHDINNLTVSGLDTLNALQPVSFVYNTDIVPDGRTRYGFVAEDTAVVDRHLTSYDAKGALSGIDDRAIISVAVRAIQELHAKFSVPTGATTTMPSAVLTADGKGIDLYKLATHTLSGMEALAARVDAQNIRLTSLEERVAALESGAVRSAGGSPVSFSTSSLASALDSFGVLIQKGIAQFNTLVFRQLVASSDADGTSSAGSVTILAGNTVAQVNSPLVSPSTKIFITFNSQTTGSWWVSDKVAGSFRVALSAPQAGDVSFDYFLVQTEGALATSAPEAASGASGGSSGLDTVAPVITLLGDNPVYLSIGGEFIEPGITVTDNADSVVPYSTFVDGIQMETSSATIDTSIQTTHIITYSATDSGGNSATATRAVIVGSTSLTTGGEAGATAYSGSQTSNTDSGSLTSFVPADDAAPVVTLVGDAAMQITVGDTFTDPGATATDPSTGSGQTSSNDSLQATDLTNKIVVTGTVDATTADLYTLTYSATDAAGNSGFVSRVVTVVAGTAAATSTSATI